ncbi:hypothetical protein ACIRG4_33220 [Streptomyces sp. NPDC102395]|uniref:hypothetical protein n=1 Tax=Streptomyces sp. NPDC102395 TaxID=3366168 RepID=UPI0037F339D1
MSARMSWSASRDAHRNGTTPPSWTTTHSTVPTAPAVTRPTDDHGIDLITHTPDDGTTLYQFKSHQPRPSPPPALPADLVP